MQKRYSITLKNFLENKKFNNKSFFINANDELVLENDNKKVEISLVPIDKSIWKDFEFGAGKHIPKIEKLFVCFIINFHSNTQSNYLKKSSALDIFS